MPTSLILESSSTSGFSKSRVVTLDARSRAGPKRDKIVESHSWPRLAIVLAAFCAAFCARTLTVAERGARGAVLARWGPAASERCWFSSMFWVCVLCTGSRCSLSCVQ